MHRRGDKRLLKVFIKDIKDKKLGIVRLAGNICDYQVLHTVTRDARVTSLYRQYVLDYWISELVQHVIIFIT